MIDLKQNEVWLVTGSQHLYGPETLKQVAADSKQIADTYNDGTNIPIKVVCKSTVKTADGIHSICKEANNADSCIGLILWMHTFSPAKMWIAGLKALQKPFYICIHSSIGISHGIPSIWIL